MPLIPAPTPTDRATAAASQRTRLLRAVVEVTAERGWAQVSVADVVARAGVSRRTFYEHFDDGASCFLAAYDVGVAAMVGSLQEQQVQGAGLPWADQLAAVLDRYLTTLADEPALARAFLVEVLAVGPAAHERYLAVVARFHRVVVALDRLAREQGVDRPPLTAVEVELLAGGLSRTVVVEVLAGRVAQLPRLHADIRAAFVRALGP